MSKIRLGIVGTGSIVSRVMPDMQNCSEISVSAIASRSLDRAEAAARKYGIPAFYGSYEELAQRPDIDLVYIALPNNCHKDVALLMMEQGKHVICEKPLALDAGEAREIVDCARKNHVFFMEAMWTRFMPAIVALSECVNAGAIGSVNHIYGCFSYACDYEKCERLITPAMGGGALLDVGVYPLMAITMLLGYKSAKVAGLADLAGSIDKRTSVSMLFESGATAQFMCGIDTESHGELLIYGSRGTISVPEFWHAERFTVTDAEGPHLYEFPAEHEGHHHEFDHAARCIQAGLKESPVVTHAESIEICAICEQIRAQCGIKFK